MPLAALRGAPASDTRNLSQQRRHPTSTDALSSAQTLLIRLPSQLRGGWAGLGIALVLFLFLFRGRPGWFVSVCAFVFLLIRCVRDLHSDSGQQAPPGTQAHGACPVGTRPHRSTPCKHAPSRRRLTSARWPACPLFAAAPRKARPAWWPQRSPGCRPRAQSFARALRACAACQCAVSCSCWACERGTSTCRAKNAVQCSSFQASLIHAHTQQHAVKRQCRHNVPEQHACCTDTVHAPGLPCSQGQTRQAAPEKL